MISKQTVLNTLLAEVGFVESHGCEIFLYKLVHMAYSDSY